MGKAQEGQVQGEAREVGASCRDVVEGGLEVLGEVAGVGDPVEGGQEAALEEAQEEGQGVGQVVVLGAKVEAEALGVLAFQVASGMEERLVEGQEGGL